MIAFLPHSAGERAKTGHTYGTQHKTLKLHRENERFRSTSLQYRRSRADMIEVFKILNGF